MSQTQSVELFEKAYLLKLFHNEKLQHHLDETEPAIFADPVKRQVVFLMRKCREQKIAVSIPNMMMISRNDKSVDAFLKKHRVKLIEENELYNLLNDLEVDCSETFFQESKRVVLRHSFSRFVDDIVDDLKYANSFNGLFEPNITALFRKGLRIHQLIYNRATEKRDQFTEMRDLINNDDEYISTCSSALNSYIGGFTRGHVDTVGAKSSHCKSSWTDYNILHTILSGKVSRVDKITPEEKAGLQLRRYAAMILKMSTTSMRLKTLKITQDHVDIIKKKLNGKLFIHDGIFKEREIRDLMTSIKSTDMWWIDHINKIEFSGSRSAMENMIGGIPGFVNFQASIAQKTNSAIVNLSQVNDKDIQRSDRLIKMPRYWDLYCSSALYQAARELLMLWYPYKDQEDALSSVGFSNTTYTPNDVFISIEKSSFTKIGKVALRFEPEYNYFFDKAVKTNLNVTAPKEKDMQDLFTN